MHQAMHSCLSKTGMVSHTYALEGCCIKRRLLLKDCQVFISKELHDNVAAPLMLPQTPLHQLGHSLTALEAFELLRMHTLSRRATGEAAGKKAPL